jgi:hypothetical protein
MSFITCMFRHLCDRLDRMQAAGIDTTDYVLRLEREFDITLPPEAESLKTLGDLRDLIVRLLSHREQRSNPNQIWERLRRVSAYDLGVDESELHPHTRLKEDLLF